MPSSCSMRIDTKGLGMSGKSPCADFDLGLGPTSHKSLPYKGQQE